MAENSGPGQFAARFPKSYFRKNSLILDSNSPSKNVYFLESGFVRQYSVSKSGSVFMTHLFRPGAFFPPTVISGIDLDSCYFEAFTSCTVRILSVAEFVGFLKSNPDLLLDYVSRLSRYFGMLSQRINLLAGFTAYQRTAATVLYLGERIGRSADGNGKIMLDEILTHKDLGAWVGTTRETTSIHMKSLQKKGLISYKDRRIIINDWNNLLKEVS